MSTASLKDYDMFYKIMLVGDHLAGKTCILRRLMEGTWKESFPTIAVDCKNYILTSEDHNIKLQIYDTAGQDKYRSLTQTFFRDISGILLVCDISNYASFENLQYWILEIKQNAPSNVSVLLVGSKSDLDENQKKVSTESFQKFASSLGLDFIQVSAKNGENIEQVFHLLCNSIRLKKNRASSIIEENIPLLMKRKSMKKKCGCNLI